MAKPAADILGDWQIFFFLGMAGIFFGAFFLLIGIILLFIGAGIQNMFLLGFAPLSLIPGGILVAIGLSKRKAARETEALANLLKAYRRIKLQKLAEKLGTTQFEAEKRVALCLERGLVKGHIDRATEEFFTLESLGHIIPQTGCPKCGAPPESIILAGETARCGSCGAVVAR